MNTHIFLQARINSSRLPSKIMKKIMGKTVIELTIERISQIKDITEIIVVTGPKEKNTELIKEIERLGIKYFCGNEENILDRFYKASLNFKSDIIIRITADCPLISSEIIDKGLKKFKNNNYDVLSNNRIRTFPHGMNFEIFNKKSLELAWKNVRKGFSTIEKFESEFIPPTKYLLEKKQFNNFDMISKENNSQVRITLDYLEDFKLIEKIFKSLYKNNEYFSLKKILHFLNNNPKLLEINKKYVLTKNTFEIEK
jgi:spore coat polysaccharide biosynthesis protein SpsF